MRLFSLNRIQGLGSCGVSEEYVLEIDLYKVYFYNSGAIYLIFVTPFTMGPRRLGPATEKRGKTIF